MVAGWGGGGAIQTELRPLPGTGPTPRVRLLPDPLIDQIAAGEVVERPASVVKELVENAVDAGATRVRVEVREGGTALIAVTDDGHGMTPEDARLALQRHATSKLTAPEDLQRIRSFGFRGEALPAIASVSRLRLQTRPAGAAEAFELLVTGGELVRERATGGPIGTRVEVADLFAQVPARRKFLRAASTEWGHVTDWLARAALAWPSIHFDVRRDDRSAITWPAAAEPLDRIAAVLSEDEAGALVPSEGREGEVRILAFASRPDWHRATGDSIHLFVNSRPVRDRVLRHAVVEVYRDLLPRGRFPAALVFVELPYSAVDVNVHPAKWEVRFADPRGVHQLITRTLREAIVRRSWIAGSAAPASALQRREEGKGALGTASTTDWIFARPAEAHSSVDEDRVPAPQVLGEAPGQTLAPLSTALPLQFSDLRLIGQLLATYLVFEGKDGLVLIDQHAAHERVLYERLRTSWAAGGVPRQALLSPLVVSVGVAETVAAAAAADSLLGLGFELEPFGDDAIAVRAIPSLLAGQDPAPLVRTLAEELLAAGRAGADQTATVRLLPELDRVCATLACHSARRKGDVLSPKEQQALAEALDTIPWAPTCPHGRPIALPLDRAEIERRFGRR
ncbi:MAG TPA: DNA mismatch repair endonuclease MutL [Myxococcota bacterium]|nr:DNA mismatch repair endonuclease MutL [Myxococcota bacterium]